MSMKQELLDWIEQVKKENMKEGSYALIRTKGRWNENKIIHTMYKSIEDFIEKGIPEADTISDEFGVSTAMWVYD